MSPLVWLCCLFITAICVISTADFTCTNNQCSCISGDCIHSCNSQQCTNQYFICPSSAKSCLIECNGYESCRQSKIYGASNSITVNCDGTNSCQGIEIFCGEPNTLPTDLSSSYTTTQFTGAITDCYINVLSSNAMDFGTVECDGSITNCILNAYSPNAITETLFDCTTENVDGYGCQLNCIETEYCHSVEFECNSALCSCGILDKNCTLNTNIKFIPNYQPSTANLLTTTNDNDNNLQQIQDQYNCMDLGKTELEIYSIVRAPRESTFHYEISGRDTHHNTVPFRYNATSESLSKSLYDIHRSIDFIKYEEDDNTYNFEWNFTAPNILCWLTAELSAIKIELYYNHNISFAFTYIYSDDILKRRNARNSDRYTLTPKNNWNLQTPVTYLENGYIYFEYHYNISLYNPSSSAPTTNPTMIPTEEPIDIIVVSPQQTTTTEQENSNNDNDDDGTIIAREPEDATTENPDFGEGHVEDDEDGDGDGDDNEDKQESVRLSASTKDDTDTHIKGVLFAVAVLAALGIICCIVGCLIWNKKRRKKEGMEAQYASAGDLDSDDDTPPPDKNKGSADKYNYKGNEANIEDSDDDEVHDMVNNMDGMIVGNGINHHILSDEQTSGNDHDIEDRRIGSGIIDDDDDDLMEQNEYDQLRNMNDNNIQRDSQSSLIKKYQKRHPKEILNAGKFETMRHGQNIEEKSESGVGYIAKSKMISTADLSDQEEEESLMVRDQDISMDAEYHHVITQAEISVIEDEIIDFTQNRAKFSLTENDHHSDHQQYNTMLVHKSISSMDDELSINHMENGPLSPPPPDPEQEEDATTVSASAASSYNHHSKVPSKPVTSVSHKNKKSGNTTNTSLGFEPGSVLDHYVDQDDTFLTLKKGINKKQPVNIEKKGKQRRDSISRSISKSLSIPPISFNDEIGKVKTVKTKTTTPQSTASTMKIFSKKIADCAAKFGHGDAITKPKKTISDEMKGAIDIMHDQHARISRRQSQRKRRSRKDIKVRKSINAMDPNDDDNDEVEHSNSNSKSSSNAFATMVIYQNEKISKIPDSQIVQSATPPPHFNIHAVNKFSDQTSTDTMIVKKDIHVINESKSLDAQLAKLHSTSDGVMLDEDTSDDSSDDEDVERDPIDNTDDEEIMDRKRHQNNLSAASNNSSHNRTMIINDDLDIAHLMHSIEED